MTKKKKCKHFDYCGAYIIRGKRWKERFCLSNNSEACVHFEDGPAKKKIFEKFQKAPAA